MKRLYPYLLTILICSSSIILSIAGYFYSVTIYTDKPFRPFSEPPVSACMQVIHDNSYLTPFSMDVSPAGVTVDYFSSFTMPDTSAKLLKCQAAPELKFQHVPESYFDDALFIGDSRTVGIASYSGLNNATYYAATSLNIFDFDKRKLKIDGMKKTIKEALTEHSFKKIYVMIGINDVGISTLDTYYHTYADVIRQIQELQSDAIIFIEGNLYVTQKKSESDKTINNENIKLRNEKIATLADHQKIFYIDINDSSLCDKDGNLFENYTWDQVHLEAKYYPIWKTFLMNHGIVLPSRK